MAKTVSITPFRRRYELGVLARLREAGASRQVLARCRKLLVAGRGRRGESAEEVANRISWERAGIKGLEMVLAGDGPPVAIVVNIHPGRQPMTCHG